MAGSVGRVSACGVDGCEEESEDGSEVTVQLPIAQVTVKLCHHHAERMSEGAEEFTSIDPREVQDQ